MAERFPEHIALALDASTRRSADGRTFLGGSPLRLLRFTAAGATAADRLLRGRDGPSTGAEALVARRLVDAGLAHPRPLRAPDVALSIVVPVRDDAAGVAALLDRLATDLVLDAETVPQQAARAARTVREVVVVDDGSADPGALISAVAGRATVVRHERSLGPGAARDTGWRAALGDVVAFVDADVEPLAGWVEPLLAHLLDPTVGVVAPRVRSRPGPTLLERYERHRSPLDLGPVEARVVPRSRVPYVPTATLLCRRAALEAVGGFDASMRVGEDVDLVWRAVEGGWTVRYEPRSEVVHRPRRTWRAWARQRQDYGEAAAALDRRHPGAVAPAELNAWSMVAWGLAALGGRLGVAAGTALAAGSSLALVPKLRVRVDDPVGTALRLGGLGTIHAGTWLGRAVWRAWLPFALVAGAWSRRARIATAAAAVVPAVLDHREAARAGPVGVDPVRWIVVHAADQAAYGVGVWRGAFAERSARCLAPRLSGLPRLSRIAPLVGKSGSSADGG